MSEARFDLEFGQRHFAPPRLAQRKGERRILDPPRFAAMLVPGVAS